MSVVITIEDDDGQHIKIMADGSKVEGLYKPEEGKSLRSAVLDGSKLVIKIDNPYMIEMDPRGSQIVENFTIGGAGK